MAIDKYLSELIAQKEALANNLVTKGIEANSDEKFNTLVPKVLDITTGGGEEEYRPEATPLDSKDVYYATRPANYPYIPLPSEMNDPESEYYSEYDQFYMLYDASNICCPHFTLNATSAVPLKVEKFMDTTLVSTEYVDYTSSYETNYMKQYTYRLSYDNEDEDWDSYNFIRISYISPNGVDGTEGESRLTRITFAQGVYDGSAGNYNDKYYVPLNSLLEISGNTTNVWGCKFVNMTYSMLPIIKYFSWNGYGSGYDSQTYEFPVSIEFNCTELICFPELTLQASTYTGYLNWLSLSSCYSLITIPAFDTSRVSTMYFMDCYSLKYIPDLDLSSMTMTGSLFSNCRTLEIPPKLFNTSKVTSMYSMFNSCYNLKYIPEMDFSSLTDVSNMFYECRSITKIPDNIDTSRCTSLKGFVYNCHSLKSLPELNTSKVTNFEEAFGYCYSLKEIPALDYSQAIYCKNMFLYCKSLQKIGNGVLELPNATSINTMLSNAGNVYLEKLYAPHATANNLLNASNIIEIGDVTLKDGLEVFYSANKLKKIKSLSFTNLTSFASIFYSCQSLERVPDLGDTSNVTTMSSAFSYCSNLKEIPELDCSSCTSMSYTFNNCKSLKRVSIKNTSKVTTFDNCFSYCYQLEGIPAIDMSAVAASYTLKNTFYNTYSLTYHKASGMRFGFDIRQNNFMTRESLLELINNLADISSTGTTQSVQVGNQLKRLTDEDKAIATAKGWSIISY